MSNYPRIIQEGSVRMVPRKPTAVEIELDIDTSKFMRAIGYLAKDRASPFELAMAQFTNSLLPLLEVTKYPAGVHELSRTTGWSLEESADIYQRVAKWAADAIAEDNIKALNRSRMSKPNHYPTSTPAWSRRKR